MVSSTLQNTQTGRLIGHFQHDDSLFEHPFKSWPSFANKVLRHREGLFESDVAKLIESGTINTDLAKRAGLKAGPLYGCQVFDHELQCGVLVLWYNQREPGGASRRCGLHRPDRRVVLATGANFAVATYKWKGDHDQKQANRDQKWKDDLDRVFAAVNDLYATSSEDKLFECAARAVSALGMKRLRVWRVQKTFSTIVYAWPASYPRRRDN